jgi:alpha 1,2-mannosyltransferase
LRKGSGPPYNTPTPAEYYHNTTIPPPERRAKAALVVLARNGDLDGVMTSMKQMEDRFNKKFQYSWVFLNEEPFSDEFKKYVLWSLNGIPEV